MRSKVPRSIRLYVVKLIWIKIGDYYHRGAATARYQSCVVDYADLGHAPDRVVGRPTSLPLVSLRPCAPHFPAPSNIARKRARERERKGNNPTLGAGPADPVLPLGSPTPFFSTLSWSHSHERFHHSGPRSAAVPLGPPMPRYTISVRGMRRQADCIRGLFFSLTRPLLVPLFALFLSLRLFFFSLSLSLLSFPCPLSRSFFFFSALFPLLSLYLSLSFSLAMRPTRAPHTITRASPTRSTQHTWPVVRSCSAECAVLPPAGDRVTWPPGRNGTQHGLCSLMSRAHDTSQRRTKRPDRQIALSLPGSACGAFSLPLFPILFLSFFFPRTLSPVPLSLLFFPFCPFVSVKRARDTSRLGSCVHPRIVYITRGHVQPSSVVCLSAARETRDESVSQWDISVHLVHRRRWCRGENRANQSCKVQQYTSCSLPHHVEMKTSASVSCLCRYTTVYRRRCGLCTGVVCQRVTNDAVAETQREIEAVVALVRTTDAPTGLHGWKWMVCILLLYTRLIDARSIVVGSCLCGRVALGC